MEREKFDSYVKWVMSYLPNTLSDDLKKQMDGQVRLKLVEFKNESIDEFCKRKNICRTCISGGYDCDADHK